MHNAKNYYPQLDAIRGISFLVVFFYHTTSGPVGLDFGQSLIRFLHTNMALSIDVFFILSSFLITLLALNEIEKKGKFSIKNFLIRRALRIWPLYYLLLISALISANFLKLYFGYQITLPPLEWYIFFVSNYYMQDHVFFLRILWTLSVEEQFYFLWGICLFLLPKKILIIIFIIASISICYNIWGAYHFKSTYFNTITYLFDMMVGAFSAFSIKQKNYIYFFLKDSNRKKSILINLSFPLFFAFSFFIDRQLNVINSHRLSVFISFVFAIYCGAFIVSQMINKPSALLEKNIFLIYTGKISFGLYCFHGLVISVSNLFLTKFILHIPYFASLFVLLILNFLIASFSYYFFEKQFLKLKYKFQV